MSLRTKFFTIAGVLFAMWLAAALAGLPVMNGAVAQKMPERRLVRKGNRQFNRGNFERSVERYSQALGKDSTSFEALYNLGNAMFRTERIENAQQMLLRAAADTTRTNEERADAFFNLGDVQFSQQNLQGALECFKNALRLNPSDMEAKYNYAYVKKLLEQQEDQNDQNQDQNNDKNNQNDQNQQNQNQNGNNDDNKDNDNSDNDNDGDRNQDQSQDQNSGGDDQQQGQDKRQQGVIPQEQAEAMLDAIQAQEDKTQDKVKEKQGVIIRGKKNW